MFDGEIAAGTAHPGHDFVGDEQHAVAAADFGDAFQVSRWGDDCAERRAAHRLENEGSRFAVCVLDGAFEFGGVLLAAVVTAVGAIESAAVAVGHADVRELADHGQIHFAATLLLPETDNAPRVDP